MARTVKCPGCGADLTVKDDNRDFMFCEFCGTKVRLDDYQETHRFVDEAKVRRVDAEHDIELKKLELEEKKMKDELKRSKQGAIIGLVMFCGGMLILILMKFGII